MVDSIVRASDWDSDFESSGNAELWDVALKIVSGED